MGGGSASLPRFFFASCHKPSPPAFFSLTRCREGNFDLVGNNIPVSAVGGWVGRLVGGWSAVGGLGSPLHFIASTSTTTTLSHPPHVAGLLHPRRHEVPGHGALPEAQP